MKHKYYYKVYTYEHKLIFETASRTSAYVWKDNNTYIYRIDLLEPERPGKYFL